MATDEILLALLLQGCTDPRNEVVFPSMAPQHNITLLAQHKEFNKDDKNQKRGTRRKKKRTTQQTCGECGNPGLLLKQPSLFVHQIVQQRGNAHLLEEIGAQE